MLETSVLIAGGGPVGLALACELGHAGIDCLMVEKRDGSITVPKMSSVSGGSMEYCRRWGIAREVRTAVWSETHALDFVYCESLLGRELTRVRVPSYATRRVDWSPEGWAHCPQIYFDPILARHVGTLGSVTRRYETGLDSFEQDGEGVTATLVSSLTGAREQVRCSWLVGCDGPGGVVRAALGIPLTGVGKLAASVNIFFRSPEMTGMHRHGWARFYRVIDDTGCWAELLPIDGRELFRLTVFDDPRAAGDPEGMLRRMMGGAFPFELISAQPWERRDYVAESYRRGRVLIAGDAAHQFSPTGGIGMHTGLEDAVNLGWKLNAVLRGWGGPHLLDSFETERRKVAVRNVGISTSTYRALISIPPRGVDRPGESWAGDMSVYALPDPFRINYTYDGSPICIPDGTPAPDYTQFVRSTRPGARLPHGWVEEDERSTLDVAGGGTGFTLLRLGSTPPDANPLLDAADRRGVPIRQVDVAAPEIARLSEVPLVLVRHDWHVAWRGGSAPADPLAVIDRVRGA